MISDNQKAILFFVTAKKHIENIDTLRPYLLSYEIKILSDVPCLCGVAVDCLNDYNDIRVVNPHFIVMFMAYPYEKRLWLMEYSLRANVPCVGIEEVHQLSLNNGRVNHYFSPLDRLAVPSQEEKDRLEKIPVPYTGNIEVTGWGFFDRISQDPCQRPKKALLFLSPLQKMDVVSQETEDIRKDLLEVGRHLVQRGFHVDVKPHPIEPRQHLEKALRAVGLEEMKIVSNANIGELLQGYDLLVNRGNSQICIEAIHFRKKLLICPLGVKTIFDGCCNVLADLSRLDDVLQNIDSKVYVAEVEELKKRYLPYEGEKSIEKVVEFIRASEDHMLPAGQKALHLSLLYFLLGDKGKSLEICEYLEPHGRDALGRFLKRPWAPRRFVKAVKLLGTDTLAQAYLSKIYLDQVSRLPLPKGLFLCDRDFIELPDQGFVPYFWGDIHQRFARLYSA